MPARNEETRFAKMVRQFKTYVITEELKKYNGNVCKTARALGIHRNSLTRQIQDLDVEVERNGRGRQPVHIVNTSKENREGSLSANSGTTQGIQANAKGEGSIHTAENKA